LWLGLTLKSSAKLRRKNAMICPIRSCQKVWV
jgi:hypothetical protein